MPYLENLNRFKNSINIALSVCLDLFTVMSFDRIYFRNWMGVELSVGEWNGLTSFSVEGDDENVWGIKI